MKKLIVFNKDNSVNCVLNSIDEIELIHFDNETMHTQELEFDSEPDIYTLSGMVLKNGELVDFEVESIEESTEMQAQQYLNATDYLVMKYVEDNRRAIPADIKANRKKCREILTANIPSADFLSI